MKNTQLTIGTTVSYTKTSLTSEPKKVQSVVTKFYDGYVWLENGDKMFKEALTILDLPTVRGVKIADLKRRMGLFNENDKDRLHESYSKLERKLMRLEK